MLKHFMNITLSMIEHVSHQQVMCVEQVLHLVLGRVRGDGILQDGRTYELL